MNDLESLYRSAVTEHRAGRLAATVALCQQILTSDQRFARAWELLGIVLHQQGDWQRAIEYIERAIALEPHWPGFYQDLGNVLLAVHRYEAAEQSLRKALSMLPDNM